MMNKEYIGLPNLEQAYILSGEELVDKGEEELTSLLSLEDSFMNLQDLYVMEKQKQAPRAQNRAPKGPTGPIYGQIEDLRANSPEDPTHAFAPGGVFSVVVSGPIPFIT